MEFVFGDINTCHPFLNEAEITVNSERMITANTLNHSDGPLLATKYILFALADILTDNSPVQERRALPK